MVRRLADTSTLGGRLRAWREARNLKQEQLAGLARVGPAQLSRYETNKERPGTVIIARLAKVLSISESALTIGGDADRVQTEVALAEFRSAESMRTHPVVYGFLADEVRRIKPLYPYAQEMMVRRVGGIRLPIPMTVMGKTANIHLGGLDLRPYTRPEAEKSEYIRKRGAVSERFFNNLSYTLRDISFSKDTCNLVGGLTDYFTVLDTHNALEHELLFAAHQLAQDNDLTVRNLARKLPKRTSFLAQMVEDQRRASTLGISTLIVYQTDDGYMLRVRKRSGGTAVHPNLLHVVPASGFAPEVDPKREWSIKHCVIKEYCEELFDRDFPKNQENPDWIYVNWEEAERLRSALAQGRAELVHAGIAFHLMSFRSDICCVLLLHDRHWFDSHLVSPNWEYLNPVDLLRQYGPGITNLPLDDIESQFLQLAPLSASGVPQGAMASGMWDPAGLAALWLGVDTARGHLGESGLKR